MSVFNVGHGLHLHSQSMLRQSLGRSCQVAGKVGQVFRRENLTRIGGQVGLVRFNLLKDRCIGFSVIAENVVKDTRQLVDLTWNRQCTDVGPRWVCCHPSQSHCGTLGNPMSDQPLHTRLYTQSFYTHTLLRIEAYSQSRVYTEQLLHTEAFTQREAFAQSSFYNLMHTETLNTQMPKLLHRQVFTHRGIYTKVLHTDAADVSTHRSF